MENVLAIIFNTPLKLLINIVHYIYNEDLHQQQTHTHTQTGTYTHTSHTGDPRTASTYSDTHTDRDSYTHRQRYTHTETHTLPQLTRLNTSH